MLVKEYSPDLIGQHEPTQAEVQGRGRVTGVLEIVVDRKTSACKTFERASGKADKMYLQPNTVLDNCKRFLPLSPLLASEVVQGAAPSPVIRFCLPADLLTGRLLVFLSPAGRCLTCQCSAMQLRRGRGPKNCITAKCVGLEIVGFVTHYRSSHAYSYRSLIIDQAVKDKRFWVRGGKEKGGERGGGKGFWGRGEKGDRGKGTQKRGRWEGKAGGRLG